MIDFGEACATMLRADDRLRELYAVRTKSFKLSLYDHDLLLELARKEHYLASTSTGFRLAGIEIRVSPRMLPGIVAMCDKDGKVLAVTRIHD